ncbi:glycoside hydrolase family 2 [Sphingobacterium haloxyli]|uniref:Glycoside hydrolase family 2 n=2 Tax=Sphingobacterium haloxyli TaxID=2100533 RepID=A0A2S9J8X6_9SPHI|nr:glycoside hydrolase family 2 [Sphingobacterium haloxyli]
MFSKFVCFLVLFVTVLPSMAQPRETIDFNGGWSFTLEDDLQFRRASFSPVNWKKVSLPHDWSIGFDFGEEYPAGNAGGALPGGIGWYRKAFQLSENDKGSHYTLYFGGVYRYAEVWLNDQYLGKNINGYLSFERDLTPYLRYGNEQNVIAVRVDNSLQPNSRWYTGSGIYRDVRLEKRAPVHLLPAETFITTPKVSTEKSSVRVQSVLSQAGSGKAGRVVLKLRDKNKKTIAEKTVLFSSSQIEGELQVDGVSLWSPDSPTLYDLDITVLDNTNKILDELRYKVGFRYFQFDENGFALNGEPFKLLGVCLHHDLGALGAAFNKSAAKRQLLIMKDMGVNAIRTAHNPFAEEFLDLCDELGFLVQNEAYDMWAKRKNKFDYHIDFKEHHIVDLITLVKRDRNHPSVFMWSIGNEIREQFDDTGVALTKGMTEVVKKLDPTRPVTAALTETNYEKNFIAQAGVLDVLGFNYKYFDYDKLPTEFKGVPLIASETTSALQTRGVYDALHDTIQLWPASSADKFVTNGNPDFTVSAYDNVAAYWGTSHERAWLEVKKRDFLGGIFVWTGFDYLGEPVPYPYPARSSYYGIVDLAGLPKDVYYMYQSEWTDTEVLHLLPHWNWKEGEQVDVWCYYNNADEVELFLNGQSLGRRSKTDERLHASWKVPYEAGELKVVKIKDGTVVQETVKKTAGKPVDIVVDVEHDRYAVDGLTDLYFLTVSLVDKNGTIVPDNDVEVSFLPQENLTIRGTDNGYQADLNSLASPKRNTYKGFAVAMIQKNSMEKGAKIIVKANTIKKEIVIK